MPDVSVARTTKNLWIDNPYYSTTYIILSFAFSNPDEEYRRYFRVYIDGVEVYEACVYTTRLVDSIALNLDDGLHEFIFEVRHGAYEKGWALEYASLENTQHDKMYTSGDLARDELFPQVYVAQIDKYVFIHDDYNTFSERIHVAVESSDPYSRYLRVRVNDQLVFQRIIYKSYETTIDVSPFMPGTGFYKVTVEIKAGHYRPWDLVYLAVERSNSKYVPIALQLILSFDWNPDTSYLNDFIAGLREFVDHSWDAYEQQVIITRIDVYVGGAMWNQANIRAHLLNDFEPNALVSYALDGQGNPVPGTFRGLQLINLPKHWPWDSTTWNHWIAYWAITHELSHAYFHLADEFITWNGDDAVCGGFWDTYSIMDVGTHSFYPRTEFCVRLNHDPDRDTVQSTWWWGWSCWETITYFNSEMYEPFGVHDTLIDNVAANFVQIVYH